MVYEHRGIVKIEFTCKSWRQQIPWPFDSRGSGGGQVNQ